MSKNICKFTSPSLPVTLSVSCFVLETTPSVMSALSVLRSNRITIVVSGKGRVRLDEAELDFEAGTLFFGFAQELFSVCDAENVSYIYIEFDGMRAQELMRRFNINKGNRIFKKFDGLVPLWNESLLRASEQNIDLAAESILLYTFSRLTSELSEQNKLLAKIIEMTEENFRNYNFSLAELADMLSYTTKYLSYFFKKKMNITYSEYLSTLRIKYAILLFDNGIDSVKNVALLSGFSEPLYFSSVFKKKIGVSPKAYIQSKK